MKKVVFNSTLKCQGCVDKVKGYLETESRIHIWDVNLTNPNKTLTLEKDDSLTEIEVIEKFKELGYVLTKVSEE